MTAYGPYRVNSMINLKGINSALFATAINAAFMWVAVPAVAAVPGVPTVDMSTLVQLKLDALEQAAQAADALKTAKDGINQVREQYDNYKSLISGNDGLGNFLNNPQINKVLPLSDWADVYTSAKDIAGLRERYKLVSSDPSLQQRFDQILSVTDALQRNFDASTERVRNAEQLRAQLNQVDTPQQKSDLQLRYQQELLEQQNQQARLANMHMLMEQQEKIDNQKHAQNFSDYMLGKTKTVPE